MFSQLRQGAGVFAAYCNRYYSCRCTNAPALAIPAAMCIAISLSMALIASPGPLLVLCGSFPPVP